MELRDLRNGEVCGSLVTGIVGVDAQGPRRLVVTADVHVVTGNTLDLDVTVRAPAAHDVGLDDVSGLHRGDRDGVRCGAPGRGHAAAFDAVIDGGDGAVTVVLARSARSCRRRRLRCGRVRVPIAERFAADDYAGQVPNFVGNCLPGHPCSPPREDQAT